MSSYTGYRPVCAADFDAAPLSKISHYSDPDKTDSAENETQNNSPQQTASTSFILYGIIACFFILLIVIISLAASGGDCKIGLCENVDKSSRRRPGYAYENFDFIAPLQTVWIALAVSAFGISIATGYMVRVLKIDDIPQLMFDLNVYLRQNIAALFFKQLYSSIILVAGLFILFGFGSSWRSGACFLLGVGFAAILALVSAYISTRGGLRITSQGKVSFQACLRVALRIASVIGVTVLSTAVGGLSISYLIFQDIRALIGFVAGISCTAMILRISGGLYRYAADVGSFSQHKFCNGIFSINLQNQCSATSAIGAVVDNISGMAVDFMATTSTAIVATAVLGASQPFFYDNAYAMCVFNHLKLDQTCVAYELPTKKVSFAASICRVETIRNTYTTLEMKQSNSAFVALPFIFGMISVIVAFLCSIKYLMNSAWDVETNDARMRRRLMTSALRRQRLRMLVASILTVACAAGLCWGLFGGRSSFRKANTSVVDKYQLPTETDENSATRCSPVATQTSIELDNLPLLELQRSAYEPTVAAVSRYPPVNEIPLRMFICILLGIILPFIVQTVMDLRMSYSCSSSLWVASSNERGVLYTVMKSFGIGLISTLPLMATAIAAVGASFSLFGSYGIGLCAIGFSSSAGTEIVYNAISPLASYADFLSHAPPRSDITTKTTKVLKFVGDGMSTLSQPHLYVAAQISCFAFISILAQETGLIPSPRRLVGLLDGKPSRHLTDYDNFDLMDIYILASAMAGIILPFVFTSFMLRLGGGAGQQMIQKLANQVRQHSQNLEENIGTERYEECTNISLSSAGIGSIIPAVIALCIPLAVGFGFGQRALLGMCLGTVPSALLLAAFLNNTGTIMANVRLLVENGHKDLGVRDEIDLSRSIYTCDAIGKGLQTCCAPSLLTLMKFTPLFSVLVVSLMQPGAERWWIGLIILLGAVTIVAGLSFVIDRRAENTELRFAERAGVVNDGGNEAKAEVNTNFVSPFYEEGPVIRKDMINPQSEFGRTAGIDAIGFGLSDDESEKVWEPVFAANSADEEPGDEPLVKPNY